MKKLCLLIIALALLLSACVYRLPQDTQGSSDPALQGSEHAPTHSDTSPSFESTEYSAAAGDSTDPQKGDTVTVGSYTFQYTSVLTEAGRVFGWALEYCEESVEYAIIPDEVLGIPVIGIGIEQDGDECEVHPFGENPSLTRIDLPDSLLYIGDNVFRYCTKLTYIKLPNSISYLGNYSPYCYGVYNNLLENTSVTFLDIPEGVERLHEYLFADSILETVILPSTLTVVEYRVFYNTPLKEVFYRGTEEQCPQTLLDEIAVTDATIYYFSETEPTEEGNFWHYVDGKPVIW